MLRFSLRLHSGRRNKSLAQTARATELFDLNLDSPTFGQIVRAQPAGDTHTHTLTHTHTHSLCVFFAQPFDSPVLGPKPRPGQRKRRSPFWRVTPGSKFAERYYTHDVELQSREKQRIAELRVAQQQKLAAVAAAALGAPGDALGVPAAVDGAAAAPLLSAPDAADAALPVGVRKWLPRDQSARVPIADATAVARQLTAEEDAARAAAQEPSAKELKKAAKKDAASAAASSSSSSATAAPAESKKVVAPTKKSKKDFELDDD
jgi:hypothetical protein